MKIYISLSNDLVQDFLDQNREQLAFYAIRDNCGIAATDMLIWAKKKGVILTKVSGFFLADKVVYTKKDFTISMVKEIKDLGKDFNSAKDRKDFIESTEQYKERWKKIPHQWLVDDKGTIYDPSGYLQFVKTKLAKDLSKRRYLENDL